MAHQPADYEPSFVVTTSHQFRWNRVVLDGLVEWDRGGTVYNASQLYFDFGPKLLPDTVAAARRVAAELAQTSNPYFQPADFIKLRELRLAYDLPAGWTRWTSATGLHFSQARVSLAGRDLLTWHSSHYTGLDPEISLSSLRGVDLGAYPPVRSYFLMLDVGF
jgi:hypothetical protein